MKKLSPSGETALRLLCKAHPDAINISSGGQRIDFEAAPGLLEIGPYLHAQAAEIEALKALVGEMADNPTPWVKTEFGDQVCWWCEQSVFKPHTPDCPITRAQELGVLPKEEGDEAE